MIVSKESICCASHLANILHVLQLPELGQCVMAQSLVQRGVTVFVADVQVTALTDQQLQNEKQPLHKKATIHQVTTMLATSKKVASMVVTFWIVAFLPSV